MLESLYTLLVASPAVTAILGSAPMRLYPNGIAPQNLPLSACYATEFTMTSPQLQLSGAAPVDATRLQLSLWSTTSPDSLEQFRLLIAAVRAQIDTRWDILDARDMGRDATTSRFRFDFDVQLFTDRPPFA